MCRQISNDAPHTIHALCCSCKPSATPHSAATPSPMVPAPGVAWRSRWAPHGSWQSFRWKATTRSSTPSAARIGATRSAAFDAALLALEVDGLPVHFTGVEHGVAAAADVDERRLHARQHVLHAAEVDVADQGGLGLPGDVVLDEHAVLDRTRTRAALQPVVVAAGGHAQHAAHRLHRGVGLVRVHEFVDPVDVLPSLAAALMFIPAARNCSMTSRSPAPSPRSTT